MRSRYYSVAYNIVLDRILTKKVVSVIFLIAFISNIGSSNSIINSALAKQFSEYLANGKKVPSIKDLKPREKRSSGDKNYEDDFRDFLNDAYPGAEQSPTMMVQMLASPQTKPDDILDSAAIFHKDNLETCQAIENECPESFFRLCEGCKCIHDPKAHMTLAEGNSYCKNFGANNAELLQFESLEELKLLDAYMKTGLYILIILILYIPILL